jgi:hypothetical protein
MEDSEFSQSSQNAALPASSNFGALGYPLVLAYFTLCVCVTSVTYSHIFSQLFLQI